MTFLQHARMKTNQDQDVAGIARTLGPHQLHVWRLRYDRARRRERLCAVLGAYLDLPPDAVVLVDGEHGRPELAPPLDRSLRFNWSHSGDAALIAVARDCAPGVDIEKLRPRPRAMQLAERFFDPAEIAALKALNRSDQERAFLQLWTAKEAVLKALGRGIAFGLNRLRLQVPPAPSRLLWLDGDEALQWHVRTLSPGNGYVASVAWRGHARQIGCWTLADGS